MKKILIVANWKSNKTELETKDWLSAIIDLKRENLENKEIIVCPPFTFLPDMKAFIDEQSLPIKLGAQDISPFDEGAHTGEINGRQIKEFADFVIVGHSERRKNFLESEDLLNKKIDKAFKYGLAVIACASNLEQIKTFQRKEKCQLIVAYEPLFAIGTGLPDTPENADGMSLSIKDVLGNIPILYGGSVDSENISGFTKKPNIDGVLVGRASLNPKEFYAIIQNA